MAHHMKQLASKMNGNIAPGGITEWDLL